MEPINKNAVQQNISNRRKFLTKSAAVITTVAAKPVWASNTSISGNLSGNLSGRTHEQALYDGCSPGYYHMHANSDKVWKSQYRSSDYPNRVHKYDLGNKWEVISYDSNSKLPKWIYRKPFNHFLGQGTGHMVFEVLSPKYWGKNGVPSDLKMERLVMTAYLNAWNAHTGVANYMVDFPYTKREVIDFYNLYLSGQITYVEATEVLNNLIHGGTPGNLDIENC